MAFTSIRDDHLPRRNARSFDLDNSAAQAAAWVWHLHASKPGVTTEGRFISSQIRRRSSNYDRKATRFRQEASIAPNTGASGSKTDTPMWDCGSNLYDTFELVSFGNRLDRSLMEAVPITPRQARPQEHHMKSPLHGPSGILRTLSLSRSLSRQKTRKSHTEVENPSPSPSKFDKQSKSDKKGTKAKSFTGLAQSKASTRWSRVRNFMNVIKRVVVLHKQVDLVGCKRSINVIESSQRPLNSISEKKDDVCARGNQLSVNEKVRANLSTSNLKEGEFVSDEFPIPSTKVSSNYGGSRGNYKLSIPSNGKSKCEKNRGNSAKAHSSSASIGSGVLTEVLPSAKIRSNSESMRDAFLTEHKKSRPRRKCVEDGFIFMDDRIKGSNLEGVNEKERVRGASYEKDVDHYRHLHHHHHHHHHHHYLHHNLASESARLSPETMSQICADQSWLI